MVSFSKFDKILVLFLVLVFGVIFTVAGNVDPAKPFHQFSQVAVGVESISDNNVLLAKYGGTGVPFCSSGQTLKWTGSSSGSWICADNSGGAGSTTVFDLNTVCSKTFVYSYGGWASYGWTAADCSAGLPSAGCVGVLSTFSAEGGAVAAKSINPGGNGFWGMGTINNPGGTVHTYSGLTSAVFENGGIAIYRHNDGTDYSTYTNLVGTVSYFCPRAVSTGGTPLPVCLSGQVLKHNGTTWACASDDVGAAGVTRVSAGTGISVNPAGGTGNVAVSNTGVTSVAAGAGISVSASTGAVTVTNTSMTQSSAVTFCNTIDTATNGQNGVISLIKNGRNICEDDDGCSYRIWKYDTRGASYRPAGAKFYTSYPVMFRQKNISNVHYWHDAYGDNTGVNGDGVNKKFLGWDEGLDIWDDYGFSESSPNSVYYLQSNSTWNAYVYFLISVCDF